MPRAPSQHRESKWATPWELTFGEEFQGKRIPFGALVNFKPTSSRKLSTKFGPDAVTGVFAGYVTKSGEGWRREYLAWPLVDFKDVDLSIDCGMVPRHLREPIMAERVSLVADKITFPLKKEYERVNTTLEGIREVASLRDGPHDLEMVDVDSPKPKLRYISERCLHYSEGTAGDGNIYVDDDGYNVKLDKLGRRYRVRSDGVREVPTSRPLGIPTEAWSRMSEGRKKRLFIQGMPSRGRASPRLQLRESRLQLKPLIQMLTLMMSTSPRMKWMDIRQVLFLKHFLSTLKPKRLKDTLEVGWLIQMLTPTPSQHLLASRLNLRRVMITRSMMMGMMFLNGKKSPRRVGK